MYCTYSLWPTCMYVCILSHTLSIHAMVSPLSYRNMQKPTYLFIHSIIQQKIHHTNNPTAIPPHPIHKTHRSPILEYPHTTSTHHTSRPPTVYPRPLPLFTHHQSSPVPTLPPPSSPPPRPAPTPPSPTHPPNSPTHSSRHPTSAPPAHTSRPPPSPFPFP